MKLMPIKTSPGRLTLGEIDTNLGFLIRTTARVFLFWALFTPLIASSAWDAPIQDYDHIPHHRLPVQFETDGNTIHWFDNTHLILSVRMLGDWTAGPTDLARIVLLDTETGAISDTPYRGDLLCFSPERMVVREHPNSNGYFRIPSTENIDFIKQRHTAGVYGEKLKLIEAKTAFLTNAPFCRERPITDPEFPEGTTIPLKDTYINKNSYGPVKFFNKEKKLINSNPEPFMGLKIQYIRTLDLYFNQSHRKPATSLARLFDERGNTRETYPYPGILWRWADEVSGTADNAWTQAGLIWNVLVGSRDERNGLYLQAKDGRFIKISRTRLSDIRISPDGCRLPILEVRRSSSLLGLGVGVYHEFFTIYNFCSKN